MDVDCECELDKVFNSGENFNELHIKYDVNLKVGEEETFGISYFEDKILLDFDHRRGVSVNNIGSAICAMFLFMDVYEDITKDRSPRDWDEFEKVRTSINNFESDLRRKLRGVFQ